LTQAQIDKNDVSARQNSITLPMAAMPMVAVPVVTMMPVMPTMPTAMVPVMPVVPVPPDLFGLETIDLVLCNDRGLHGIGARRNHGLLG
jgi:hypothetical protein